jgi:hypothetical protein
MFLAVAAAVETHLSAITDGVTKSTMLEMMKSSPTRNVVRKSSVPLKRTHAPERSEPLVDLLGGFDDNTFSAPAPSPGANNELPNVGIDGMFHFLKSTKSFWSLYIVSFFYQMMTLLISKQLLCRHQLLQRQPLPNLRYLPWKARFFSSSFFTGMKIHETRLDDTGFPV